jgi:hypothetical protein
MFSVDPIGHHGTKQYNPGTQKHKVHGVPEHEVPPSIKKADKKENRGRDPKHEFKSNE